MRAAILDMLFAILPGIGYPIAWPGVKFTPPGSGAWLEVSIFEGTGQQPGMAYDSSYYPEGIIQVSAVTRTGFGFKPADDAAHAVVAALPAGTVIQDGIKITRRPTIGGELIDSDKLYLDVTARYGP